MPAVPVVAAGPGPVGTCGVMRLRALLLAVPGSTLLAFAVTLALPSASPSVGAASLTSSATIHPGIQLLVPQGGGAAGTQSFSQCTANFVYSNGGATFIGMAAHCAGTGSSSQTDCTSPVLAPGVPVYIGEGPVYDGSTGLQVGEDTQGPEVGTMVYDSWYTMQHDGVPIVEAGPTCQYNDLALVKVLPGLSVDPTVPFWGGPGALATTSPAQGSTVFSYQNSALRLGLSPLSPKVGVSLGDTPGSAGWSHIVETLTPGIPGDSGSGFLDATGDAFGVLSTIDAGTPPGAYGVDNAAGDLAHELAFCDAYGGLGTVTLVPGTTPFSG